MPDDAPLRDACRTVAPDLVATGVPTPVAARALEQAYAARAWWLEAWPEGAEHLLSLVAQDVQDAVSREHDPRWPLCPEHGDHALAVEPELGPDPFWVCEISGLPVSQVGSLPPLA